MHKWDLHGSVWTNYTHSHSFLFLHNAQRGQNSSMLEELKLDLHKVPVHAGAICCWSDQQSNILREQNIYKKWQYLHRTGRLSLNNMSWHLHCLWLPTFGGLPALPQRNIDQPKILALINNFQTQLGGAEKSWRKTGGIDRKHRNIYSEDSICTFITQWTHGRVTYQLGITTKISSPWNFRNGKKHHFLKQHFLKGESGSIKSASTCNSSV